MTSALLALVLAAAPTPVLIVPKLVANGDPGAEAAARGLASLLEDDLRRVPGLLVRTEADVADPANKGKLRGATHLVSGTLFRAAGSEAVLLRVVGVADQRVVGTAKASVKGGAWNLARVELVTAVAKALKVPVPESLAVEGVTGEQLEAWGRVLALADAKDAKARAAVLDLLKRWPGFGPAERLLERLSP